MRVSILTATSEWGGAEFHAVTLAQTLKNRGHEVSIAELGHDVYRQQKSLLDLNVEVVPIELNTALEKVSFTEALRMLWPLRGGIIVFEKGALDSGNYWFDLAARLLSRRYVTIEQLIAERMPQKSTGRYLGGLIPGVGLWWAKAYLALWSRGLAPHAVVCVSEAVRSRLTHEYRFPLMKTVTIYNGIDTTRFQHRFEDRARLRQEWGIPPDAMVFGAIGRLAVVKGYDLAIEAFKDVRFAFPDRDLWLVLVGDGPSKENLRKLAVKSGVDGRVRFPGFANRPWESYRGLDVFLMPSLTEGMPHALIEAMASGCPPIAMGVGGVPEVITEPDIGWLVAERDREGFCAAMNSAVRSDPEKLADMGRRAREKVVSQFDSKALLERLADLIEFGVDGHKRISNSDTKISRVGI